MHQYPHMTLVVALGLYNFLKDPHGVVFHSIRFVARWVVEMAMLGIILIILANIAIAVAHFGFHIPLVQINATVKGWDSHIQHARQVVEALQRKL